VVYDVNLRQNYFNREIIEQSLELAHVVKLNGDEALVLGELLEIDVSDLEAFAGILRERFQVDLTCVTRGGEGCILFSAESTAEVPGEEVTVVDAVGAGDAFTAALITTRLRGIALETSAAFANRVGGLVASRAGAMPDLRSELQGLLPDL
jgi:fructokinase